MEEPADSPSPSVEQFPPYGSKIAFLFSVGEGINEDFDSFTKHIDALRVNQSDVDIILTGVIHLSGFLRTRGGDSESKRIITAFNLDVEWIKKHADFFIRLQGKYKIQSALVMKYTELNIQEITDFFVKPKDESLGAFEDARVNTLAKIEAWQKKVQRIVEQTDLVIDSEYQDAIKRIAELTSLERLKNPTVSREEKRQIRDYQSKVDRLIETSHTLTPTKPYLYSESELYLYLWKLFYKFTLYARGDTNSVLMYIESVILNNQVRHLLLSDEGKLVMARTFSYVVTPEKKDRAFSDGSGGTSSSSSSNDTRGNRGPRKGRRSSSYGDFDKLSKAELLKKNSVFLGNSASTAFTEQNILETTTRELIRRGDPKFLVEVMLALRQTGWKLRASPGEDVVPLLSLSREHTSFTEERESTEGSQETSPRSIPPP